MEQKNTTNKKKERSMTLGMMQTDVEQRIDFGAMRAYKFKRVQEQLDKYDMGAVLLFDPDNIRYATSTWLNDWAHDKFVRWAVVPRGGDTVLFESGARPRKLELCPWLKKENIRHSRRWNRGAHDPNSFPALSKLIIDDIKEVLKANKVEKMPLGIDIIDAGLLQMFEQSGLKIVAGYPAMYDARIIKSPDELKLIELAASLVDCCYQEVSEFIKPGVREHEVVGKAFGWLMSHGANRITGMNCISGPRTNPNSHDFSDRMIRPGDMVFMDIMAHYLGYGTCYYRTMVVTKATQRQKDVYQRCLDMLMDAVDAVKPGVTTADVAAKFPSAQSMGFASEAEASGVCTGHGIGLSIHEKPWVNRIVSFDYPTTIEEGMHFALETHYGEGEDGARLELQLIVTKTGRKIITKFPYEDLTVCAPRL
jgi:Xaa-Pro dipeptidase